MRRMIVAAVAMAVYSLWADVKSVVDAGLITWTGAQSSLSLANGLALLDVYPATEALYVNRDPRKVANGGHFDSTVPAAVTNKFIASVTAAGNDDVTNGILVVWRFSEGRYASRFNYSVVTATTETVTCPHVFISSCVTQTVQFAAIDKDMLASLNGGKPLKGSDLQELWPRITELVAPYSATVFVGQAPHITITPEIDTIYENAKTGNLSIELSEAPEEDIKIAIAVQSMADDKPGILEFQTYELTVKANQTTPAAPNKTLKYKYSALDGTPGSADQGFFVTATVLDEEYTNYFTRGECEVYILNQPPVILPLQPENVITNTAVFVGEEFQIEWSATDVVRDLTNGLTAKWYVNDVLKDTVIITNSAPTNTTLVLLQEGFNEVKLVVTDKDNGQSECSWYFMAEQRSIASGREGNCITWTILPNGTLVIGGNGGTLDYNKEGTSPTINDRPWNAYRNMIKTLVVDDGVINIGNRAFQGYQFLEKVVFPNTLKSIGVWAFQNCTSLTDITMPNGVKISTGAFRNTPVELDIAATESAAYVRSVYYERLVQTSLTGNYRNDVIAIAKSQIGYRGGRCEADYGGECLSGSGDYSEYGRYFNTAPSAWCSEFASWCVRMSGAPISVVNSSSSAKANAFCAGSYASYYTWSQTIWGEGNYLPRKGDIILWVWSGFSGEFGYNQSLSHTTLIENYSVNDDKVVISVVHGNYSGGKVVTTDFIVSKSNGYLSDGKGYVGYFVAPDYEYGEIDKCVVEFDANGGSVNISQKTATIEGLYGPLPVPYRKGYSFLGWRNKEGKVVNMYSPCRIADGEVIPGSSASEGEKIVITLSARWILDAEAIPDFIISDGVLTGVELNGATSVEIPNSVTSIGEGAFWRCTGLTSVTIPGSVTNIGNWAFRYCSSLVNVSIGNSVTDIGEYAFGNCGNMTSVTIGDSVTNIGAGAFWRCNGLTSVTIPDSVIDVGNWSFRYCSGLTNVTIPDSVMNVGNYAFCDCSNLTSVAIGNSVTNIGNWAFRHCSSLMNVSIGNSVTDIGEYAFGNCGNMTSVTIGDSVTNIGAGAFWRCNGLTSVTIPDSVIDVGNWSFRYCSGLTNVTMPDSVMNVGNYAFCDCSNLTSVVLSDCLTNIGNWAFRYCSKLENLTIPDRVTNIGSYAFSDCSSITQVVFMGNAPTTGSYAFSNLNSDCVASVSRNSTGWGVEIPGTWNGMRIEYYLFPPLPDGAKTGEVATAFSGAADAGLAANVTDGTNYNAFCRWAARVKGESGSAAVGAQTVKESAKAWLSYALGADRLIEKEITSNDVQIVSFETVAWDAQPCQFALDVAIDGVEIGSGLVEEAVLKENLKKVLGVEGAASLNPAAFSSDNVEIKFDTPVDGRAKIIVTAHGDSGDSFFMRAKVK